MKHLKLYKQIQNTLPLFALGKSSGFRMPGVRALGYEPGTEVDRSGWSNQAGNSLSGAIEQSKRAVTQAHIGTGAATLGALAGPFLNAYQSGALDKGSSTAAQVGAGLTGSGATLSGGLSSGAYTIGANGFIPAALIAQGGAIEAGLISAQTSGSAAASSGSSAAGSAASTAGAIAGGLAALYNGINFIGTLSNIPTVDEGTMKSTQSRGTAMANGVKYNRVGSVNVGEIQTLLDLYDLQTNAALRTSEIGMGAGIGGAIGTIGGPIGSLIGSGIGAGVGALISLFTGVDETEIARERAEEINRATELVNQDQRDRAASRGIRMNANYGKISTAKYDKGKNSILKQHKRINGMLLPLNKDYGKYIS